MLRVSLPSEMIEHDMKMWIGTDIVLSVVFNKGAFGHEKSETALLSEREEYEVES